MKKVFALILTALMLSSLTACSRNEKPDDGYINVGIDQNNKPDGFSKPEEASKLDDTVKNDESSKLDNNSKPDDSSKYDESSKTDDNSTPEESSKPDDNSKPADSVKPETPSAQGVKLPLADYPNGSYFTKDGKACDDHSDCNWMHDCNCINFDLSIQAFSFARYVYFTVNGEHLGNVTKTSADADITAETAKSMLKGLPAGSYICVRTKEDSPHAMIVISASDDNITVYQANYGGNCVVSAPTYTWAEFARRFPHITEYAEAVNSGTGSSSGNSGTNHSASAQEPEDDPDDKAITLIGLDGTPVTGQFYDKYDNSSIDVLTSENAARVVCYDFAYFSVPTGICRTNLDNPGVYSEADYSFADVDMSPKTDYVKVRVGEKFCGLTLKKAEMRFAQNGSCQLYEMTGDEKFLRGIVFFGRIGGI